jgi:hypothetical protein
VNHQFQDALVAPAQSVAADFSANSDTLLVAFGGIAAGIGIPPFEFFRMVGELSVKKLFVRDLEQAWYHRGLLGIADDIRGAADYLAVQIAEQRVARTVFVGNSMGGYAAVLFGSLLRANVAHAFAPQTFLGKTSRMLYLDRRWRVPIRKLHRVPYKDAALLDLRRVLSQTKSDTEVHVHFPALHRLDRIHARRLQAIANVTLHSYPTDGHNLVRHLRDTGALRSILLQSLGTPIQSMRAA